MIADNSNNEVKNYDVSKSFGSEFAKLTKTEFDLILKCGVPSSVMMGNDVESLIYNSYGFVKEDCRELLESQKYTEMIQLLLKERGFEYTIEQIESSNYNELLANLIWVLDQLKRISEIEKEKLSSTPDADLINAGVNELDELGVFNIIDSLAGGDVLKYDDVRRTPYYVIFDKLRKDAISAKVSKNYAKIQQNKIKNRG